MTSELRRPATGRRDVCPEPDGQPEVTTYCVEKHLNVLRLLRSQDEACRETATA
jgi:hypothetical protein